MVNSTLKKEVDQFSQIISEKNTDPEKLHEVEFQKGLSFTYITPEVFASCIDP